MSCSPVKIIGSGPSTNVTPVGHPLLIANLKPLTNDNALDEELSRCRTEDGTSVEYPARYEGFNAVIRAPIALNFQPSPGGNDSACGSDDVDVVRALGGSAGSETSSVSSTASSLLLPSAFINSSTAWSFTTTPTLSSSENSPFAINLESSSRCTCGQDETSPPQSPPGQELPGEVRTGMASHL